MHKITLALWLFAAPVFAQAPALFWQKNFGGSGNDQSNGVCATADGGFILAGKSNSSDGQLTQNRGGFDFWVVKTDASGNLQWQRSMGGSQEDIAEHVLQTAEGGYLITGYTDSQDGDVVSSHGLRDVLLVRLDASGQIIWTKTYGGSSYDDGQIALELSDGSFLVGATTHSGDGDVSQASGNGDIWLLHMDAQGNLLDEHIYGGSSHEFLTNLRPVPSGGYILSGMATSTDGLLAQNHGMHDLWIIRLDENLNVLWQTALGGSGTDAANDVVAMSDGTFLATGTVYSQDGQVGPTHGSADAWVVRLDAGGNLIWKKNYGGSRGDAGVRIEEAANNGFVLLGNTHSGDGDVQGYHSNYWDSGDGWLVRADAWGNILWQRALGGNDTEYFMEFVKLPDGGFALGGQTVSQNNGDVTSNYGSADFWLVRMESDVLSEETFNTERFKLHPNPVSQTLHIDTTAALDFSLRIFDLSSKTVLMSNNTPNLDVSALAAGIYAVEITSAQQRQTTKLIKL